MSDAKKGWAREHEALNNTLMIQLQTGDVYMSPEDVIENLRVLGLSAGGKAEIPTFDAPVVEDDGPDHDPDHEYYDPEIDGPEEDYDA